ncbi:xanthine dehydrogenase small subunit [Undibacterium sp. Jales W-56]|uniref:xanthine dehydrogenase small subunit n=1 Tax=Undibacterium sp. Jales W-56 TaxID=2897325 RepID=UPI0021CEBE24|nr:xanthine dehydrogenase small subunit [Undibacterium sp. Jales W-56]MCU6434906.1 xanthine dehydrogenase small subunit [Undibacterium sp. Jales W-56]
MPDPIHFYFRGKKHQVSDAAPTRTLLQYLREDLHCSGTKEGCAEGDCGACTVVIGELKQDQLQMTSVNACLQFLPTLDGKAIFTVEDLNANGHLHPVQQAMVACHGSQCGFCTPGFVMSLWDLYLREVDTDSGCPKTSLERKQIDIALSGNLCRCTGYRPIIDAAQQMCALPRQQFDREALRQALRGMQRTQALSYQLRDQRFDAPHTLAALLSLRAAKPAAVLLAGATDVGLWVTKQLRDLGEIIYLGEVAELQQVALQDGMLSIGATVPLEDAYQAAANYYPELNDLWQRFASLPIRHIGTLGGNVANGSPIGDSMPWLIVLGAQIVLSSLAEQRSMPLEDFYLGYQKKDLRPDEVLTAVQLPLPAARQIFRTYKLAKRFDQDISAVCAAFSAQLTGDRLSNVRMAFGGMAATPKRATMAEACLENQVWDEANLVKAMAALAQDYAPLSDMRASSDYRMKTAQNLLRRFWLETRPDAPLPKTAVDVFARSTITADGVQA